MLQDFYFHQQVLHQLCLRAASKQRERRGQRRSYTRHDGGVLHRSRGEQSPYYEVETNWKLIDKKEARGRLEAITESGGTTRVMGRRAKRIREGQAQERKKEGEPAHFGAHINKTRFRKTGLLKSKKGNGPILLLHREALNIRN